LPAQKAQAFGGAVGDTRRTELLLVGGQAVISAHGEPLGQERLGLHRAQQSIDQAQAVGRVATQAPGLGCVLGWRVGATVQPEGSHGRGELRHARRRVFRNWIKRHARHCTQAGAALGGVDGDLDHDTPGVLVGRHRNLSAHAYPRVMRDKVQDLGTTQETRA